VSQEKSTIEKSTARYDNPLLFLSANPGRKSALMITNESIMFLEYPNI